ncbi:MAG TPA: DUF1559 domain-containing protein, partial [Gemmataceae bacterium]|nr:DUF1559 domain-containing protein [Gemmataceae bacterium]
GGGGNQGGGNQGGNQGGNENPGENLPGEKKQPVDPVLPPIDPNSLAGDAFTNFLPPGSQSVYEIRFKDFVNSPLGTAAFLPGAFDDKDMSERVGFSVKAIDKLIHAENYTQRWTFIVLHTMEGIDKYGPLKRSLGLEPAEEKAIRGQDYFKVTRNAHWLLNLGRLSLGVPVHVRNAQPDDMTGPLYLRRHDRQTLVIAHLAPMREFLNVEGEFPAWGGNKVAQNPAPAPAGQAQQPAPAQQPPRGQPDPRGGQGGQPMPMPMGDQPMGGQPKPKGDGGQPPQQPSRAASGTYATINPVLKATLDRMAARKENSNDKVIFISATEMKFARVVSRQAEDKYRVLWRVKPVWDITNLLDEKTERISVLGSSLQMKDAQSYVFQNTMHCPSDTEANGLKEDVVELAAPKVTKLFRFLLNHPVELPKVEVKVDNIPNPFNPGGGINPMPQPMPMPQPPREGGIPNPNDPKQPPKEEEITKSRIAVTQTGKDVLFRLDLLLDGPAYQRLEGVLYLVMCGLKTEVEVAEAAARRHDLAQAGNKLGEDGLRDSRVKPGPYRVQPGEYPPGAFPRPAGEKRTAREPGHRISWMAGLLPHLGHKNLYDQIAFDKSWKDAVNWLPARTLIPEFIDPLYPRHTHFATYPGMPLDTAGTHYVGLTGVGLDSADYRANDPEVLNKLGVFGYERGASLKDIRDGRGGLGNTILMVRVPHDGPAGVTPWMAGGGSTLRAVPENNSVEPFLSTEKDGSRGTFLLMTDGSVRYVKKGPDGKTIPDDVFKAMATIRGPAPVDIDAWAQTVAPPPKVELPPLDPKE